MPLVPYESFPFCGPTWQAVSPIIDAQQSLNLYPETEFRSSKTSIALIGRPGLGAPLVTLAGGKARSIFTLTNALNLEPARMFAVGGNHFYEVFSNGTTTDYGNMVGDLTDNQPCQAQPNGTQLLVCDCQASQIFNANPSGPSMDAVFSGVALEYLDGFYLAIATTPSHGTPGLVGTNPNQINASAFGDGTNWLPGAGSTPAYAIRTGSADLTIQLAVLNGLLWIFGEKNIEIWYDAGTSPFPLARVNGGQINTGCLAKYSVAKGPNCLFWLGADDRGYARVYQSQGLSAVPISTPAIETYINSFYIANGSIPLNSVGYCYMEAGHTFYVLVLGGTGFAGNACIVYDMNTQFWHTRSYASGNFPIGFASAPAYGFTANNNFVVNGVDSNIYPQSISFPSDNGTVITYQRTAPHVADHNRWIKYPRLELDGSFGNAVPMLDYSNDGGQTFGPPSPYPMQQAAPQGNPANIPELRRYFALQLGRSRDRVFRVTITSSADSIRVANAYLTANGGTER